MLMLDKKGAVLETAVKVSRLFERHHLDAAVIGGVAVVLHGHIRTTRDVDVLVRGPLEACREAFESAGMTFEKAEREFLCDEVPVHLVEQEMVRPVPGRFIDIEQIRTVRLADLISMKLHSGTENILRAQDIADVIGLIRGNKLSAGFARLIDKPVRAEFRKLVAAIGKDGG